MFAEAIHVKDIEQSNLQGKIGAELCFGMEDISTRN